MPTVFRAVATARNLRLHQFIWILVANSSRLTCHPIQAVKKGIKRSREDEKSTEGPVKPGSWGVLPPELAQSIVARLTSGGEGAAAGKGGGGEMVDSGRLALQRLSATCKGLRRAVLSEHLTTVILTGADYPRGRHE